MPRKGKVSVGSECYWNVSQLESGPHHGKEGRVQWALIERPPLSHSVPCTAPHESQLGSRCSTIPAVILLSGNLNVFIMMSSAQVFLIEDFSMYYLTCYSTKTWVHGPLPLENLSEFIYLNMSLFSAQPTNSVRAGTLFCPPFYRPGAWMSV